MFKLESNLEYEEKQINRNIQKGHTKNVNLWDSVYSLTDWSTAVGLMHNFVALNS